jgi:O-acetyl-ADP-ribose deacetylase
VSSWPRANVGARGDWAAGRQERVTWASGFTSWRRDRGDLRDDPPVDASSIQAVRGDITAAHVDAIVNAANRSLARGAGVCGAIFAAAGPELDRACAALGGCAPGDAVVTDGFALPARWIVHTVGPVWQGGERGEPDLLRSCYRGSIAVAREVGAASIAFPAISTGIFGYPPDAAAEIAVESVRADGSDMLVQLVAFDAETLRRYESLLS